MSEIKLLPCPFCGGEVAMNQDDDGYYVSCCKEGCVVMTNSYTEEKAVEVWNTRKPMQEIVERLEKELEMAESEKSRCVFQGLPYFDSVKGYVNGLHNAIATVKEVGGMNE